MSAVISQPELVIRTMRDADIDRVMEIEQNGYDFPWSAAIFYDCLRVGYRCSVLTAGDQIIAYSIVSIGAGEAHLLNLCVAQAHTGVGHGSNMVSHALEIAGAAGCSDIFLEVRPSNHKALRLYQRFGFRAIGTRPHYYRAVNGREDACVLTATLNAGTHDRPYVTLAVDSPKLRH